MRRSVQHTQLYVINVTKVEFHVQRYSWCTCFYFQLVQLNSDVIFMIRS